MKYTMTVLFIIISTAHSWAQTELLIPIEIKTPEQLKAFLGDSIIKTFSVDFNGDQKQDYITVVNTGLSDEPLTREYWYNSDFRLYRKVDLIIMDYDFKFFINLDGDSIPEIFRAQGYSDGIDYYFTKLNATINDEDVLFYFNPIIKKTEHDQNKYFWGHPWRLKSIFLQKGNSNLKILSALNHNIIKDSEIHYPEDHTCFPIIVFDGEPKSEYDYSEKINNVEWMSLERYN